MWDSLKTFFDDLSGGDRPQARFADNDYRVAAAALLVHASAIDGQASIQERNKLEELLRARFGLDHAAAEELIEEATDAESEAVDMYRFTSLLNRELDQQGRLRLVEMLWEIVYADGQASELEDNLLWRVADLLHVPTRDRVLLRQRVVSQRQDS